MATFNRDTVFSLVAKSVQAGMKSTMVQSIGLAQLLLTGDISEDQRLALVGLKEVPTSTNRLEYDAYKYSGKLVAAAAEVRLVAKDIQELIMAVDVSSITSIKQFQGTCAVHGDYITTTAGFNRFLAKHLTEEAKAAKAAAEATKKPNRKAAKATTTETAKATGAAPDSVTVQAASAAAEADSRDVQAHNALVEMMGNSDIFAAAIKAASLLTGDQARLALVQAWKKDHAAQAAEIATLKAKLAKATAPRKTKAKPVNPAMAEAMSQATTEALKQALAS